MNFLQFQVKPISKIEAALNKVTGSEFATVPVEDMEAVKQFLNTGGPDGAQMSHQERQVMESKIWTHIFDLLEMKSTWRPTYQALMLFAFLLDSPKCQRWIYSRQASLNSRIERLTAFIDSSDKRVQALVRREASIVQSRLDAMYSRWDKEKEDETGNEMDDEDLEIQLNDERLTNIGSSIPLDERKQKQQEEGDIREDQKLLQMLEEEEWPPPSWRDSQLDEEAKMIGLATSETYSRELVPVDGYNETSPRMDALSVESGDRVVHTSGWKRTFKLWCCCLSSFLRIK